MNRENLEILYSVLTGPLPHRFDMEEFTLGEITEEYPCGTAACALGSLPVMIPREEGEGWCDYGNRVLGIHSFEHEYEWDWLFSCKWSSVDNTQAGAAARVRYLLDYGLPEDGEEQMLGKAELCYLNLVRPEVSV